ncbi:MAG: hypothetical protein APR55_06615 [Methanolinea sp. SDB]|nr:MAG: hypothetical protein APR55_06615 [Methanolinea sp. SDB]
MAHPSRQRRGKAMRLVPVPGVTLSTDHAYVCGSRQGAGIPDFPGLPCLSEKSRGLHAWEMVRRACHSPAVRENGLFLPTNAGGGQSGYGQQGAPCRILQDDEK